MRAITVQQHGGPEELRLGRGDAPEPGPGEVLVDVAAAGVNFIDIYQRSGVYPQPLPFTAGNEGAGTVRAVGADVDELSPGRRVAWTGVAGSYADQVTAAASAMVPLPAGLQTETAAAVMLQGLTAHYLAGSSYPVTEGDSVLIHAGAGGVGLLLTQIVRLRGGRPITTVSTEAKAELSRQAGAAEVLRYDTLSRDELARQVRSLTGGEGVAAVYDGVGAGTFESSLHALRRRGTLVLFGAASGQVPAFDLQRLNPLGSLFVTRPTLADHIATRAELLQRTGELFDWLAAGRLHVRIGGRYPLVDAAQAHHDLAARRTTGKLLLTV